MMRELGAGFQLTEVFSIMVRREGGAEVGRRRRALWRVIGVALAMVCVTAEPQEVVANDIGPIFPVTGAPGEPITGDGATCALVVGCHTDFDVNSGPGALTIDAPSSYESGMTYAITVDVAQADQMRWGFQMTVLDELLEKAGDLANLDANTQVVLFPPRQYVSHTLAGTAEGRANDNSWTFQWTAPDADVGAVTFYAAGNAANGNDAVTGDYIYTTTATVPAPEPGATAAGLLALTVAAGLAGWKDRPRRKDRPQADA